MIRLSLSLVAFVGAVLLGLAGTSQAQTPIEKVTKAIPESAPAKPKQPRKVLIFSRTTGFRHGSIGIGSKAIAMMGDKTGAYTAFHTEDESFFEPEKLAKFDAVFMLNTTGEVFRGKGGKEREDMLKKSLVDFVAGGKGLMGVHSATDTYHNWKDYNMMMGGTFDGHPWVKKLPLKNLDPKSPLMAAFDGKDFEIMDEYYQFKGDTAQAKDRRYLLVFDTAKMDQGDVKRGNGKHDGVYPVSWAANFGKGRTFYCSLGHHDDIYWNPVVLRHYLAGLQYVLGDLQADATPTTDTKTKSTPSKAESK